MKLLVDRNGRKELARWLLALLRAIVSFAGSGLGMGGELTMGGLCREFVIVYE